MVKFGAEQADRAQPGRAASLGGGVHDVHQRIFAYKPAAPYGDQPVERLAGRLRGAAVAAAHP
jgi:hypothetical protein